MANKNIFLEKIRQQEIRETGKFLGIEIDIKIESTFEMESNYKIDSEIKFKEFKTEKLSKIFFLAIAIAIFSMPVISIINNSSSIVSNLILLMLPVLLLIFLAVRMFFFDKKLNYKIYLDKTGILIKGKLFKWIEIYDTAILSKGTGRGKVEYLIILLNDMKTYEKFKLKNFNGFKIYSIGFRLAKYIELFKSVK